MNSLSAAGAKPVNIDLLIRPQWIIPIEPAGITLSGHSLAVSEGRIVAVLPNAKRPRNASIRGRPWTCRGRSCCRDWSTCIPMPR